MRLSTISGLVRGHLWYDSKIPPLLAVAYATMGLQGIPASDAIPASAALLVSSASLAAYAHVLNDIFDMEVDKRAGKQQALSRLPIRKQWLLCLLLAFLGFLPWLLIRLNPAGRGLLALIYLLPLVYNIPPLRLKERGVWGPITDAAQAHVIPTLFVVALFTGLAPRPSSYSMLLVCAAAAWASFRGLRGGLRHQLWDRDNDLRAGITTFATSNDPALLRTLLRRIVFPGEIVLLFVFGAVIFTYAPAAVVVLVIYAAVFQLARLAGVWNVTLDPCGSCPPGSGPAVTYVPLDEFYTVWPALALGLALTTRELLYGVLVALHVIVYWSAFRKQAADFVGMAAGLGSKLARMFRRLFRGTAHRIGRAFFARRLKRP